MSENVNKSLPKIKIPNISGAQFNSCNAQFIISSGIPALDHNLDGGLAVGSLLLLEEDVSGSVAKTLFKYFIAEGVLCENGLFIASQDIDPKFLYDNQLPSEVIPEDDYVPEHIPDAKMNIAWRYQKQQQLNKIAKNEKSFGHYFDLSRKMSEELLNHCDPIFWNNNLKNSPDLNSNTPPFAYDDLLMQIRYHIENYGYNLYEGIKLDGRNVLRIGLHSLGSPMWGLDENNEDSIQRLFKFIYALRAVVRSSLSVAFITIPSHFYEDPEIIKRIQHLCDFCIRTESFSGSKKETNPLFKDFHGLFHLIKQAPINRMETYIPESFDLAYRTLRKRFLIEKLHLPPELEVTQQREQDDYPNYPLSCSSLGPKSNLDF